MAADNKAILAAIEVHRAAILQLESMLTNANFVTSIDLTVEEGQIARSNLLAAIKLYRTRLGCGLVEAKNAVEAWLRKDRSQIPF